MIPAQLGPSRQPTPGGGSRAVRRAVGTPQAGTPKLRPSQGGVRRRPSGDKENLQPLAAAAAASGLGKPSAARSLVPGLGLGGDDPAGAALVKKPIESGVNGAGGSSSAVRTRGLSSRRPSDSNLAPGGFSGPSAPSPAMGDHGVAGPNVSGVSRQRSSRNRDDSADVSIVQSPSAAPARRRSSAVGSASRRPLHQAAPGSSQKQRPVSGSSQAQSNDENPRHSQQHQSHHQSQQQQQQSHQQSRVSAAAAETPRRPVGGAEDLGLDTSLRSLRRPRASAAASGASRPPALRLLGQKLGGGAQRILSSDNSQDLEKSFEDPVVAPAPVEPEPQSQSQSQTQAQSQSQSQKPSEPDAAPVVKQEESSEIKAILNWVPLPWDQLQRIKQQQQQQQQQPQQQPQKSQAKPASRSSDPDTDDSVVSGSSRAAPPSPKPRPAHARHNRSELSLRPDPQRPQEVPQRLNQSARPAPVQPSVSSVDDLEDAEENPGFVEASSGFHQLNPPQPAPQSNQASQSFHQAPPSARQSHSQHSGAQGPHNRLSLNIGGGNGNVSMIGSAVPGNSSSAASSSSSSAAAGAGVVATPGMRMSDTFAQHQQRQAARELGSSGGGGGLNSSRLHHNAHNPNNPNNISLNSSVGQNSSNPSINLSCLGQSQVTAGSSSFQPPTPLNISGASAASVPDSVASLSSVSCSSTVLQMPTPRSAAANANASANGNANANAAGSLGAQGFAVPVGGGSHRSSTRLQRRQQLVEHFQLPQEQPQPQQSHQAQGGAAGEVSASIQAAGAQASHPEHQQPHSQQSQHSQHSQQSQQAQQPQPHALDPSTRRLSTRRQAESAIAGSAAAAPGTTEPDAGADPDDNRTQLDPRNFQHQQQQQQQQQKQAGAAASSRLSHQFARPPTPMRRQNREGSEDLRDEPQQPQQQQQQQQQSASKQPQQQQQPQQSSRPKEQHPAQPEAAGSPLKEVVVNRRRYRILQVLGQGGSGKVWRVLDEKHRIMALKCIHLTEDSRNDSVSNYRAEIATLKKLAGCKHVIQLWDSEERVEPDGSRRVYLVLEAGDSDFERILRQHKGGMDDISIRYYWQQMLMCVKDCHDAGVIHSDLKPANFVVVGGRLKIIDFGISRQVLNDHTSVLRESLVGTVNYMSPEAIQGAGEPANQADDDIRLRVSTDIWSLGCILYQMVYGKAPFQHLQQVMRRLFAIQDKNHKISYPLPLYMRGLESPQHRVLADLFHLLKWCLQREQHRRPTVDQLLAHPYLNPHTNPMIPTPAPAPAAASAAKGDAGGDGSAAPRVVKKKVAKAPPPQPVQQVQPVQPVQQAQPQQSAQQASASAEP